jgi:hypothetical protein
MTSIHSTSSTALSNLLAVVLIVVDSRLCALKAERTAQRRPD